ncbi:MAG: protein kinase [Chloroflexi bacterium]|nr:protein kinase [Chloroflexota bacterium]
MSTLPYETFPAPTFLEPGTVLNERYEILDRIAKGGTAVVYRAHDRASGEEVALKILSPLLALDAGMLQRFQQEGDALRQLKHPGIVGFQETLVYDGQYVIVMEYVPGGNLRQEIEKGNLLLARARQIALDLCDALIRAHRLGIIHRDIKPENVLIAADGTPRLTDFGIARLAAQNQRLTVTGDRWGTPNYMPPEAWTSGELDEQSDVWSLGVLFFEMLAGTAPFAGETQPVVMRRILEAQLPDLQKLRPEIPAPLARVIAKMLARAKSNRYLTMRQVAADFEKATPMIPSPSPARPRAQRITLGAGIALVLAGIFFAVANSSNSPRGQIALNSTATPEPTSTATSAPTRAPTQTPTPILRASATLPSSSNADRAREFAEPILRALVNIGPDFSDDFEKNSGQWRGALVPPPFGTSGEMVIQQGVLRAVNLVGQINFFHDALFGIQDYVLEFDSRQIEGNVDSRQELFFRSDLFRLHIYGARRNFQILKMNPTDPNGATQIFRNGVTSPLGEWTRFRFVGRGDQLAIHVNGAPAFDYQDSDLRQSGQMYFACYSAAVGICEYDNIKLWRLEKHPGLP